MQVTSMSVVVSGTLVFAVALAVIAAGWVLYGILIQNGRILLRIEILERHLQWRRIPGETPAARKQRLFRGFSVGNRFEAQNIFAPVGHMDEYGIGDRGFAPEDVIVDVGAHIGVFSYLCYIQGSRAVHSYEPGERNFHLLQRNLGALPGVHLSRLAVWRSDTRSRRALLLSGSAGQNTGSHTVLSGGRVFDFPSQALVDTSGAHAVSSVALDEILESFPRVRLLKLDCEGSEFPILLTSRQLQRVEQIVAEVHEIAEPAMALLDPHSLVPGFAAYRVRHSRRQPRVPGLPSQHQAGTPSHVLDRCLPHVTGWPDMIRIASYLDNEGGWARHATAFALALNRHERTSLVDWLDVQRPGRVLRACRRIFPSDSVGISMGAIDRTMRLDTRYRIVFCIWETTRIPPPVLFHVRRADMVWTMSDWGRELLEAQGVPAENIRIVPAGVDTVRFQPPAAGRSPDARFRFLCVGKWEERKGSAGLVRAFAEEFDPLEPVELVMHCGASRSRGRDFRREIAEVLAAAHRPDARVTVSEPLEAAAFVALMRSCHAFVLPTRAEGWGLPIIEAMACALPCIVTGYSGLQAYANEDNCYLVRVQAMVKVEDPEFFAPRYDWGLWAEPDWEHLRQLMRVVYENREAALAKGRRARQDVERSWTWDLAARKALAHIQELRARGGR